MSGDEDVVVSVESSSDYGAIVTGSKRKETNHSAPRKVNDLTPESGRRQRAWLHCCNALFPAGTLPQLRQIFRLAWPVVTTQVCQMLLGPMSLIFCGHLGDPIQLDGAALGISMIDVTCISIAIGLGTACDTYFSQTFGSKNKTLVGVYVQRAVYIFLLVLMPFYAIQLNLGSFLVLVGQNPEVSRLAGRYMVIFMPGALSFFMFTILSKYIQNQNIVLPNVVIGIVANIVNAVLHYVFLYRLHWGTDGSALAQMFAYFTMFALTLLYIIRTKAYKDTWGGWTLDSLQDWGKFARISIPGMLMVCMECWGYELGIFLTGLLGTTELGAQSVLLQISNLWYQVPFGIQIATSIRIGQLLGARDEIGAKTVARLSTAILITVSLIQMTILLTFLYQLPYIFTNVSDIAALTSKLMPIVMAYLLFDGIATANKGILCGTGRQVYGAVVLFISYYVIALPIGISLMFLTWLRSAGYWWGIAVNLILQSIVLSWIVLRTDWSYQVQRAQERAGITVGELIPHEDEMQVDEKVDERTGLLNSAQRPTAEHSETRRLTFASLSITEIGSIITTQNKLSTLQLIFRRGSVVFLMGLVLAAGVAGHLLINVQPSTSYANSTTTIHPGFPVEKTTSTIL